MAPNSNSSKRPRRPAEWLFSFRVVRSSIETAETFTGLLSRTLVALASRTALTCRRFESTVCPEAVVAIRARAKHAIIMQGNIFCDDKGVFVSFLLFSNFFLLGTA